MNVSFVSLGCDKNRVNTEQMMALCLQAGITVQEDCPGSDVVVINTCGFIDSAKSEAIDTILSAAQLKEEGQIGKILVTGCLSQRYQADILEELPEIDGMEIEVAKAEVTDEDINNRLEALRQRFGTLVGVDRPAAKGDYANIDLTAEIDGEVVDSQEGVSYELGSETMLDGLDEALEGLSAGEETTFEGTLEAGEHEGEKAQVKVKVNSVKAEELPELDDDFASEASEFDTLDELKEDLKKAASQDAEGRQATAARDAFIAKLEEGLEIPVPKGVKAEMVEQQLKGVTADPANATKEQKAEAEETVEKELRDQMVLDVLAEKLDVKVSQSDVFNFLASIAQQYGMDPNAFIQAIMRNGQLGSAVQEVGRSKGLLAGMRAVTFKSEGETLDLSAFLGEAAEDEEAESVEAASAAAAVADELASEE